MRYRRKSSLIGKNVVGTVFVLLFSGAIHTATADMGFAVVPTSTIYPGEEITANRIEEVEVTNPKLTGGYAQRAGEVVGLVTKRTLVAGRTIQLSSLREPFAVQRGTNVRITFTLGNLAISASGAPMQDASVGDVIRVRNLDSGIIVSGTVMQDGTIHVVAK